MERYFPFLRDWESVVGFAIAVMAVTALERNGRQKIVVGHIAAAFDQAAKAIVGALPNKKS